MPNDFSIIETNQRKVKRGVSLDGYGTESLKILPLFALTTPMPCVTLIKVELLSKTTGRFYFAL